MQLEGSWQPDGMAGSRLAAFPCPHPSQPCSQQGVMVTITAFVIRCCPSPRTRQLRSKFREAFSASSTIPCGCRTQHLLLGPPWTPKSLLLGWFRAQCLLSAQARLDGSCHSQPPNPAQGLCSSPCSCPVPELWLGVLPLCWHQFHVPGVQSRDLTLAARSRSEALGKALEDPCRIVPCPACGSLSSRQILELAGPGLPCPGGFCVPEARLG